MSVESHSGVMILGPDTAYKVWRILSIDFEDLATEKVRKHPHGTKVINSRFAALSFHEEEVFKSRRCAKEINSLQCYPIID